MSKEPSVLGGITLVAGTCIGAGTLALPVLTSLGGFLPASILFLASWLVMACTGLLYLEVCLWMDKDANIVSMAGRILGPIGKMIVWFVYLYLFYSLTVAYVSGSGAVIADLFDDAIPRWLGIFIFIALFCPLVFIGPRAVDRTNFLMVIGLALTYVLFVALGISHVRLSLLERVSWGQAFLALPVIFVSFGYQGILPTLTTYMKRRPEKVRAVILLGSLLPFIGYMVWEWLILGIVPVEGEHGLAAALTGGDTGVRPLRFALDTPAIYIIGEFFAFFALTSSFLGVTLGLRDFLADGFGVKKTRSARLWLCLIIFVPAFIISMTSPDLFITALRYGGGIGGALLLGALPVILVWVGRYKHGLKAPYQMKGGRLGLTIIAAFVVLVLISDLLVW